MKSIGPASLRVRRLSRRNVLWTGGTGLAAGLLSPGLVGLAIEPKHGAGKIQMHAKGHGGPEPAFRGLPIKEVRRSSSPKSAVR